VNADELAVTNVGRRPQRDASYYGTACTLKRRLDGEDETVRLACEFT
jgi:hypothetical protein